MAIVKKVKEKEDNPRWEPFITITLSKREAAAIQVLIGGMHANSMGTDDLHNQIGDLLDEEIEDCTFRLPSLTYTDINAEQKAAYKLDKLFGKA